MSPTPTATITYTVHNQVLSGSGTAALTGVSVPAGLRSGDTIVTSDRTNPYAPGDYYATVTNVRTNPNGSVVLEYEVGDPVGAIPDEVPCIACAEYFKLSDLEWNHDPYQAELDGIVADEGWWCSRCLQERRDDV